MLPAALILLQTSGSKAIQVGPEAFLVREGQRTKSFRKPVYTVPMGQVLELRTTENSSTGFGWSEVSLRPRGTLIVVKAREERPPQKPGVPAMAGAPDKVAFRFMPRRPGRTEVELYYSQPWIKDPNKRGEWVRFNVVVPKSDALPTRARGGR